MVVDLCGSVAHENVVRPPTRVSQLPPLSLPTAHCRVAFYLTYSNAPLLTHCAGTALSGSKTLQFSYCFCINNLKDADNFCSNKKILLALRISPELPLQSLVWRTSSDLHRFRCLTGSSFPMASDILDMNLQLIATIGLRE